MESMTKCKAPNGIYKCFGMLYEANTKNSCIALACLFVLGLFSELLFSVSNFKLLINIMPKTLY